MAQLNTPSAQVIERRSFFVRLVRFLGWLCAGIGTLALASLASIYVPCFMGSPDSCVSGVLLLFGGIFVVLFGGLGLLLLFLTRRRTTS